MNSDFFIERPLPHSQDAESAVLAAMFLDSPGIHEAVAQLEPNEFFLRVHQIIFRHLKALQREGKLPDTVILLDALRASGELDAAGGECYVSSVADGYPKIMNLPHYVEIIRQKARLRRRIHVGQEIQDLAFGAIGDGANALQAIEKLSALLRIDVGQKRILRFRSGSEIAMETCSEIEWLVPGYVAKGAITELGAKVKTGKTTLITKLVRAVAEGEDFLGRPTLRSPTVYLTEERFVSFREAVKRAGLWGRSDFHVLHHTEACGMPWAQVVAEAVTKCKEVGAKLLVIDTLAQFAGLRGDTENNSGDALAAMQPLLQAANEGLAIILARHERKSGGDIGDSGRGSSAFAGAADIVLSLRKLEGNGKKEQRVLRALSRFSETPSGLRIELTNEGYVSRGEPEDAAFVVAKESIAEIVPDSESEALNIDEIAKSADVPRTTAQRAIKELEAEGTLGRVGKGRRGDQRRYFRIGMVSAQPQS